MTAPAIRRGTFGTGPHVPHAEALGPTDRLRNAVAPVRLREAAGEGALERVRRGPIPLTPMPGDRNPAPRIVKALSAKPERDA